MKLFFRIRYMVIIAVVHALGGALLLFLVGGFRTIEAFLIVLGLKDAIGQENSQTAVIFIIESLDNFLLGFVLLYFAYRTYFLFVAKDMSLEIREKVDRLPWQKVKDLEHMKRVFLEVILVLLAAFFLKLIIIENDALEWR